MTDEEFNKHAARPSKAFEIFVDMDGVLSDFEGHAKTEGKYTPAGKINWDALDYDWWVTMPAYDGAKGFYETLKQHGNVRILTSPVLSTDCFRGKAAWVENVWKEKGKFALQDLIICHSGDKRFLARPNHILVDDREMNIREWIAAGGIGILHKGDFADTLKRLQQAVAGFQKPLAPPDFKL